MIRCRNVYLSMLYVYNAWRYIWICHIPVFGLEIGYGVSSFKYMVYSAPNTYTSFGDLRIRL